MPIFRQHPATHGSDIQHFHSQIQRLTSKRKVRPVITPSGKRARGVFPSNKAFGRARFESLLEQDVLRVLEVSSTVVQYRTHPVVLALPGDKVMHYTPDVLVEWSGGGLLVETKATYFLREPKSRNRMHEVAKRLKDHQIDWMLIAEGDVRFDGFQEELRELLRCRPSIGRRRSGIDLNDWDPLRETPMNPEMERRWRVAQRECDLLLQRVMRRDPDELIHCSH